MELLPQTAVKFGGGGGNLHLIKAENSKILWIIFGVNAAVSSIARTSESQARRIRMHREIFLN